MYSLLQPGPSPFPAILPYHRPRSSGRLAAAPEIFQGAYSPQGGSGLIAMLEVVHSDYAKLESTTEAQESKAKQDFERLSSELQVLKAGVARVVDLRGFEAGFWHGHWLVLEPFRAVCMGFQWFSSGFWCRRGVARERPGAQEGVEAGEGAAHRGQEVRLAGRREGASRLPKRPFWSDFK